MTTKRVSTGIPGFDDLVQGGFPQGSSVLLAGGPGTGKTIFALQFLVNGALKFKEKSVYVSFEQPADALRAQASQFGWDLAALERKGLLQLLCVPAKDIDAKTIERVREVVKKSGARRMVIDSLSTLTVNAPIYAQAGSLMLKDLLQDTTVLAPPVVGEHVVSKFIYGFIDDLRSLQPCTSLLISEAPSRDSSSMREALGEYVCDGVILVNFESLGGDFSRSLIVRKMRQTKNDEDVHPVEISKKGIVVHSIE